MSIKLEVAQVLETWLPTQFKKYKDDNGIDLPPGTIRVRTRATADGGQDK